MRFCFQKLKKRPGLAPTYFRGWGRRVEASLVYTEFQTVLVTERDPLSREQNILSDSSLFEQ